MLLPPNDRLCVLRFAASFLWADLHVDDTEQAFFVGLARELGVPDASLATVAAILSSPPAGEEVDPTRVPRNLAETVRAVALRAIASDGRIMAREMELFALLDELLPPDSVPQVPDGDGEELRHVARELLPRATAPQVPS